MATITLGSIVTSCDDDDEVIIPMETSTFNDGNGLELTYSSNPLLGKQAVFTPSEDNMKATIALSGADFTVEGLPFILPGSGIVPGKESMTLNVDLQHNGDMATFEGDEVIDGVSVTYKGSVNKSFLKLDMNVVMPTNPLTNKTIYFYKGEKPGSDFDPLILDWCYMKDLGFDYDNDGKNDLTEDHAFSLFSPMFGLPLFNKMTLPEFLYGVLSEVKFLPDGNIQASYKDAPTDASYKSSPLNIASYQFVEEGKIKLFLNPDMIHYITTNVKTLSSRSGEADLTEGITQAVALISACLKNGITMRYEKNEAGYLEFYLDDETVARPLFSILVPIVQHPAVLGLLEPLVKDNIPEGLVIMGFMPVTPEFAWNMVSGFLKSTPDMLPTTKYLKLGMVFSEQPKN